MLPDISITKRAGGLGRQKPADDGISALISQGVAVAGKLVLEQVYELRSLQAAEQLGITATAANLSKVHYQISEFYRKSPGAILMLMVVPQDVTLTEMADRTLAYAKKLLTAKNGRVKQLGLHLNPAAGYVPTITTGIDADVLGAVAKAQALAAEEFLQHRPVFICIGGHGLAADTSAAADLTTKLAELVSVVVAADHLQAPLEPAVGALLGTISAAQVHLCIGWVNDGMQLQGDGRFMQAGLCNGKANEDLLPGELGALNDFGYIVATQHPGADGFFFADSPTCSAPSATNDLINIESVRTINKGARLIRQALLPQLKGPLLLQANGTLQPQVLNELEKKAGSTLEVQMGRTGEISAYDVYIDPEQVLSNGGDFEVEFSVVPVGVARHIKATIGLVTSI
jgi:hypothetical protein